MPRLHKTLADYVAIAISPALIMVLVGSLVFFLASVFYQGEYPTRLNIILGLFVFASVLIARISIEQGRAHAAPFAIALACATGFALFRFVEYQGAIPPSLTMLVNLTLMVVIWWSADKLTYDCTVIDEGKRASSEGLMQTIGFDDEPARGQAPKQSEAKPDDDKSSAKEKPASAREPAGTTSRDEADKPRSWWDRHVERKERPHAPGLWVVYFSLAALPIFGFGQGLIPSTDVETRRWVFWLFCAYLAAGLGLLISTSFLGLRRYLRQRQVEMPSSMAGWWLVTGSLLVLGFLVVTALLPRPAAEYAISDLSLKATSPVKTPSNFAIGGEGVETKNSGRGSSQTDQPPSDNSPATSGKRSESNQQGSSQQGNQSSQGNQGQSNQGESSPGNGDQKSNDQSSGSQDDNSSQQDNSGNQQNEQQNNQSSGDQQGSNSQSGGDRSDQQSGGQDSQGSQQQGNNNQSGDQQSNINSGDQNSGSQQSGDQSQGTNQGQSGDQSSDAGSSNRNRDEQQDRGNQQNNSSSSSGDSGGGRVSQGNDDQENQEQDEDENDEDDNGGGSGEADEESGGSGSSSGSSSEGEAASANDMPDPESQSWFDDVDWLTTGFKWLIYLIVGIVVLYVLRRHGKEILRGFREFLANLKAFLLRLFGGAPPKAKESVVAKEAKPQGPPPRPFSSYADPFSSGMADKVPPQELVRYSFEAFEAWARDHGRPRGEEETPHEFAHDVARSSKAVAKDARNLADLYDHAAYAPQGVTPEKAMTLSGLWQRLRNKRESTSSNKATTP